MNDFAIPGGNLDGFPAAPANFIRPGKTPLSASAPVIVTDENGDVKMILGSSGGPRIITAVVTVSILLALDLQNVVKFTTCMPSQLQIQL